MLTRQEDVTYLEKKPAKGRPNGTRCGVPFRSATHGPEGSRFGLGEKVGQGQTKWHTVRYAVSSCHTWPKITAAWPGWIRASDRNAPYQTNGCQTLKTATLNTFYFCQKRPLCQPPPSPTPPPNSHFVRKVKLRLAYRLAFVTYKNIKTIGPLQNARTHANMLRRFQKYQGSRWIV